MVTRPAILPQNRLLRFAVAGFPAFLLAIPLNWALVGALGMSKPAAYAIVLACQVVANFFMCYYFVFNRGNDEPVLRQLAKYSTGILTFRILDWAVYSAATTCLNVPFLLMQLINVVAFMLMKYAFVKGIMGRTGVASEAVCSNDPSSPH